MKPVPETTKNIDEYIAGFPQGVREILLKVRAMIKAAAPEAVEAISYQIPAFKLKGIPMIYMAAYKNHFSLYPPPRPGTEIDGELAAYRVSKGTLKFHLDKPLPYDLIEKIIAYRLQETIEKIPARSKK